MWRRDDGRWEIPGGHVDWDDQKNQAESYEEAALREIVEELLLDRMWECSEEQAQDRLRGSLKPVEKVINQIPSSHVNNNEWVTVFRLDWPRDSQDPCEYLNDPKRQQEKEKPEGKLPEWKTLDEIRKTSLANPMQINSALRLFLRRNRIMVPVLLAEYYEEYGKYCAKTCPPPPWHCDPRHWKR